MTEGLVEDEAIAEPEAEVNPMQTFVDDILTKNFAGAQTTFNDMLGNKLSDALDAEKVALSQQVYNGEEPDDEEQMELDLDQDEEYEDDLEDGAEEYTSDTDEEETEVED